VRASLIPSAADAPKSALNQFGFDCGCTKPTTQQIAAMVEETNAAVWTPAYEASRLEEMISRFKVGGARPEPSVQAPAGRIFSCTGAGQGIPAKLSHAGQSCRGAGSVG
jgi:hypothetical protein